MKVSLALLPILALMGCGRDPFMPPIAPSGTRPPDPNAFFVPLPPPPTVASVRDIVVGERVEGMFGNGSESNPGEHHFNITVPTDGMLELTLHWDPSATGTTLMLSALGRRLPQSTLNRSPISGQVSVREGVRYLIVLSLASTSSIPRDRYVLTSALYPPIFDELAQ